MADNGVLVNKFISLEEPTGGGAADDVLGAVKHAFDVIGWSWSSASSKLCGVITDD